MHAHAAIGVEGASAHKARQLARRLSPLQIHLKESILRVQKSQRASAL